MRRLLIGISMSLGAVVSAVAADLPPVYTKAPTPPPAAWSWTGFYFGLQGGAGWGTSQDSLTATQTCPLGVCGPIIPVTPLPDLFQSTYGLNGLHGGGTAGLNWQTGSVVWGVEGDISAADINGGGDCSSPFGNPTASCHTNMTWFATLTGRLGFAVDHALIYIKAGGAWAQFNHTVLSGNIGIPTSLTTSNIGDNRSGYTVGAGIEYAFWKNWSAKVEYNYMDFGTKNLAFPFINSTPSLAGVAFADDRERVHVIKAGLNYRFSW